MTRSPDRSFRIGLAAFLLLAWSALAAAEIKPYSARYSIYRNGKLTGKADVTLSQSGQAWLLKSEGSGTHGLARILGARDTEEAAGTVRDGRFLPARYVRHTRLAGMDEVWSARFDWTTNSVQIMQDGEETSLELVQPAMDPLTLKLEIRQRLADHNPELKFWLVDEDRIKEQNFRRLQPERLETSLGCLDTLPVEKMRVNSKRYTRAWHAPRLDYVAVRIEHGKTGGDHMEMRITELALESGQVVPVPGCAAMQSRTREVDGTDP
jgi:hypothetical protein